MNRSEFRTELEQVVAEAAKNEFMVEGSFMARTSDSDTPNYEVEITRLADRPFR